MTPRRAMLHLAGAALLYHALPRKAHAMSTDNQPSPTDEFIAQHTRLFLQWRFEEGFTDQHMDPIDAEELMTGNCLARADLMLARCKGAGLDVEMLHCNMRGKPHAIVRHLDSGLVSDHALAQPRTLERRYDLTDVRPIADWHTSQEERDAHAKSL